MTPTAQPSTLAPMTRAVEDDALTRNRTAQSLRQSFSDGSIQRQASVYGCCMYSHDWAPAGWSTACSKSLPDWIESASSIDFACCGAMMEVPLSQPASRWLADCATHGPCGTVAVMVACTRDKAYRPHVVFHLETGAQLKRSQRQSWRVYRS